MVKPYGSTFLIFSDYMRPAIRLSALGRVPALWVYSHDSIGVGEDGPTHQPIEHYMALRAIPNLWFVRPADANETVYAWKVALERRDGPVVLALIAAEASGSRPLRAGRGVGSRARRLRPLGGGGRERAARSDPDRHRLGGRSQRSPRRGSCPSGASARASSRCPAGSCSSSQSEDYQESVLPAEVQARLSVEAGISLGWRRWVGDARRLGGDRPLRRVRPRRGADEAVRLHRREHRGSGPGSARHGFRERLQEER